MSDLATADKVVEILGDRRKWRQAAGMVMCALPLEARRDIVAAGEDEFIRVARPGFHGQGYHTEDLRHIYRMILRKTQQDVPAIPVIHES